jgi:hypothetical protein
MFDLRKLLGVDHSNLQASHKNLRAQMPLPALPYLQHMNPDGSGGGPVPGNAIVAQPPHQLQVSAVPLQGNLQQSDGADGYMPQVTLNSAFNQGGVPQDPSYSMSPVAHLNSMHITPPQHHLRSFLNRF